jgi:hypothetical protein
MFASFGHPRSRAVPGRFADQNSAEVVDVSIGWTRRQEIAEAGEKARRIVVREKRGRIEAEAARPARGRAIDDGTGRVARAATAAVGAVGISRQRGDAR